MLFKYLYSLITGVNTEFMEYFVDKMTYEMEQEKRKQLQNVNNELQIKNKDLLAEMRRLRHSLQNNTLSNLIPNERFDHTFIQFHMNLNKKFLAFAITLTSSMLLEGI